MEGGEREAGDGGAEELDGGAGAEVDGVVGPPLGAAFVEDGAGGEAEQAMPV